MPLQSSSLFQALNFRLFVNPLGFRFPAPPHRFGRVLSADRHAAAWCETRSCTAGTRSPGSGGRSSLGFLREVFDSLEQGQDLAGMPTNRLRRPRLASCVACVGLAEIQGLSEGPLAIAVQIQAREAAAEENLLGVRVLGGLWDFRSLGVVGAAAGPGTWAWQSFGARAVL